MLLAEYLSEETIQERNQERLTPSAPFIEDESETKSKGTIQAKMRASLSNLGEQSVSTMTLNADKRKWVIILIGKNFCRECDHWICFTINFIIYIEQGD